MGFINHLTLPEYYYLYALYFDYPLNNAFHIEREEEQRMRDLLRYVQPLIGLRQPYRKSFALRLFTERQMLERFPPEQVDEALRQLKQALLQLRPELERKAPELHRRAQQGAAREATRHATRNLTPPAEPAESMPNPWPGVDDPPPPIRYGFRA